MTLISSIYGVLGGVVSNELSIDIRFLPRQTIIRFPLSFLDTTAFLGGLLSRRLMLFSGLLLWRHGMHIASKARVLFTEADISYQYHHSKVLLLLIRIRVVRRLYLHTVLISLLRIEYRFYARQHLASRQTI